MEQATKGFEDKLKKNLTIFQMKLGESKQSSMTPKPS
jgi:hypothetical protein